MGFCEFNRSGRIARWRAHPRHRRIAAGAGGRGAGSQRTGDRSCIFCAGGGACRRRPIRRPALATVSRPTCGRATSRASPIWSSRLGFGWVKQQVRWEYAEPQPGAIQWQEMDSIVNTMNGNGINVMFSVVTSPPWARPNLGGTGGPPEDFQLFANFLGSIAGRYCGSLQAIEVWNEQNLRREWEGFPTGAGASTWSCSSARTCHQGRLPSAAGDQRGYHPGWLQRCRL